MIFDNDTLVTCSQREIKVTAWFNLKPEASTYVSSLSPKKLEKLEQNLKQRLSYGYGSIRAFSINRGFNERPENIYIEFHDAEHISSTIDEICEYLSEAMTK